jgi:hypothetical protein
MMFGGEKGMVGLIPLGGLEAQFEGWKQSGVQREVRIEEEMKRGKSWRRIDRPIRVQSREAGILRMGGGDVGRGVAAAHLLLYRRVVVTVAVPTTLAVCVSWGQRGGEVEPVTLASWPRWGRGQKERWSVRDSH